jgi:hypothetical protein
MSKTNNELTTAREKDVSKDKIHKDSRGRQRVLVFQGGGALGAYEAGGGERFTITLEKKKVKDLKKKCLILLQELLLER